MPIAIIFPLLYCFLTSWVPWHLPSEVAPSQSLVQLNKLAELSDDPWECWRKINKVKKRILEAIFKSSVEPAGATDTAQNAAESGVILMI